MQQDLYRRGVLLHQRPLYPAPLEVVQLEEQDNGPLYERRKKATVVLQEYNLGRVKRGYLRAIQQSPFSILLVLYSRVLWLTDDGDQLTEAGKEEDAGENLNLSVQCTFVTV